MKTGNQIWCLRQIPQEINEDAVWRVFLRIYLRKRIRGLGRNLKVIMSVVTNVWIYPPPSAAVQGVERLRLKSSKSLPTGLSRPSTQLESRRIRHQDLAKPHFMNPSIPSKSSNVASHLALWQRCWLSN